MIDIATLAFAPDATPADKINAVCDALKLTIAATFVPYSQSRNSKPSDTRDKPWPSLNWRVAIQRDGRDVLTTDYSQGTAHTPAGKAPGKAFDCAHYVEVTARQKAIAHEIETGRIATWSFGELNRGVGKPIAPPSRDGVIWSLIQDCSVLDAGGFEDWAGDLGYDPDSRTAERIWNACLHDALKIRAAIGEAGIDALRTAGEDY